MGTTQKTINIKDLFERAYEMGGSLQAFTVAELLGEGKPVGVQDERDRELFFKARAAASQTSGRSHIVLLDEMDLLERKPHALSTGAARVRELCAEARARALNTGTFPFVFIDEIEALPRQRSAGSHPEYDLFIKQLRAEIAAGNGVILGTVSGGTNPVAPTSR